MRRFLAGLAACAALGACATGVVPGLLAAPQSAVPVTAASPHIVAAVADPLRPQADRDRDALRHPAEILAFAGVEPGESVADVGPGGGYYTRMFATAVGPQGQVYGVIRTPAPNANPPAIAAVAAQYPNITVLPQGYQSWAAPAPLDVIFISQIYHDFHLPAQPAREATATQPAAPARPALDVPALNASLLAALKPGGTLVIIDHAAVAGSDLTVPSTLHRIDQALVRRELEAAGFVYDGEINVLRNPADNRTVRVFEGDIRGHTDQFAMRFRKPG